MLYRSFSLQCLTNPLRHRRFLVRHRIVGLRSRTDLLRYRSYLLRCLTNPPRCRRFLVRYRTVELRLGIAVPFKGRVMNRKQIGFSQT